MINKIPTSIATPESELLTTAARQLDDQGFLEYCAAIHFFTIWPDIFDDVHGKLNAISQCTNPDDPPDIVAHFERGDILMEVTDIDPGHIHQNNKLHRQMGGNAGRNKIPISKRPKNADEAMAIMYTPGHPDAWENLTDRTVARADALLGQAKKKFTNPRILALTPGILLFTGNICGDQFDRPLIEAGFQAIHQTIPASRPWILAMCHRWNSSGGYYSAFLHPSLGFQQRP